mgnify:CR=1 FL=1
MKINDIYEVIIESVDDIGNGVTRINNIVVFIPYTLSNEKVKIKIVSISKRFAVGKVIEFITKSDKRCEVKCNCYNECGGCNFLHINFNDELSIKINYINKLFNTNINTVLTNNEYNYRNKATFHIKDGKIGYYSEKTNDIIEFNNCLLLDNRINDIYNYLKEHELSTISEVIIRVTTKDIMIVFKGEKYDINDIINHFNITSIYLNDKLIYGESYIIEEIDNIKYSIYPDSFFQVNKDNMKIMYNKAREYAGYGNNLLDLYCGTGTIGIYLKDNFKHIDGIEINKDSIKNANINKKLNNINNIKFISGDASIAKNNNYDVIIVDPPRSGLSNKVINFLDKSNSKRIVYISCNPKTLKRDIDLLKNYKMIKLEIINMFNKTKHIECITLLEKY